MTRLTPRLQIVYDQLIKNQDVWDFCCDHGYLGGAAYKSQNFKDIYFVDPIASIIQKLEAQFLKYLYRNDSSSTAYFITKNAQQIENPVFGTASIVGVGGLLIYEILETLSRKKCLLAQRLVLGPHRDREKLLELIKNNELFSSYTLTSQKEISENQRLRLVLVFDRIK